MFSKDDLEYLALNFAFPVEKKETLVEEVVKKIPLGALELKTPTTYQLFTRLTDRIPQLSFSSEWAECRLAKKNLTLELGVRPPFIFQEKEERRKLITKAFSEETLAKLNSDMSFLIGKISALLEEKKLKIKSSGHIRLGKKLESEVSFNNNLKEEVLSSFKEIGKVHLKNFGIDLIKKEGISSIHIRSLKKRMIVDVDFRFPSNKPINISELITNTLTELNEHYQKLRVD